MYLINCNDLLLTFIYTNFTISEWYAIPVNPGPGDWIIGGDGIITCDYGPENVYTEKKYDDVEWSYQAPKTTSFQRVYYYQRDGRNASFGHLTGRATHKQTRTQIKLVIQNTVSTDDGIYRGKIQGSDTAICDVNYTTRSKFTFTYRSHII